MAESGPGAGHNQSKLTDEELKTEIEEAVKARAEAGTRAESGNDAIMLAIARMREAYPDDDALAEFSSRVLSIRPRKGKGPVQRFAAFYRKKGQYSDAESTRLTHAVNTWWANPDHGPAADIVRWVVERGGRKNLYAAREKPKKPGKEQLQRLRALGPIIEVERPPALDGFRPGHCSAFVELTTGGLRVFGLIDEFAAAASFVAAAKVLERRAGDPPPLQTHQLDFLPGGRNCEPQPSQPDVPSETESEPPASAAEPTARKSEPLSPTTRAERQAFVDHLMVSEGVLSVRGVVARLNADKVPTHRGGPWRISSVQSYVTDCRARYPDLPRAPRGHRKAARGKRESDDGDDDSERGRTDVTARAQEVRGMPGVENTKIEWTDATWNFAHGCAHAGRECERCYAERGNARGMWPRHRAASGSDGKWSGEVTEASEVQWSKPDRLPAGYKVFTLSMGDFFYEKIPIMWQKRAFDIMDRTPHLVYQVLTKRPAVAARRLEMLGRKLPPNVWFGISVGCRDSFPLVKPFRSIEATIKFISVEPLLEPVVPGLDLTGVDWVIAGGESGPGARPCRVEWVRALRDHCVARSVPFFFKQWGDFPGNNPTPVDQELALKSKGGATLDGKLWRQFPRSKY